MKDTQSQQQGLLDSRQTLSLYLENLFQEEVVDQEEAVKKQSAPAKRQDMEVMLLHFGQHKLAMPIKELKAVTKIGATPLSQLPEQPPYVLGMVPYNGKNVPVYDLNWVFNSENKLKEPEKVTNKDEVEQVIILKGEHMGLVCDGSEQILNLKQDEIRWNRHQGKNCWLQGIVLEHMATLLDICQIKRIFRNGLKLEKK